MHNNSNIRNKQMVINTCKIYPFSKFRGLMPAKWPIFLGFANSRLPLKKCPLFRENGYERGIRFGREWGRAPVPLATAATPVVRFRSCAKLSSFNCQASFFIDFWFSACLHGLWVCKGSSKMEFVKVYIDISWCLHEDYEGLPWWGMVWRNTKSP